MQIKSYLFLIKILGIRTGKILKLSLKKGSDQKTEGEIKSGWPDLNRRPPAPHAGAIPGYATSRNECAILDKIFELY